MDSPDNGAASWRPMSGRRRQRQAPCLFASVAAARCAMMLSGESARGQANRKGHACPTNETLRSIRSSGIRSRPRRFKPGRSFPGGRRGHGPAGPAIGRHLLRHFPRLLSGRFSGRPGERAPGAGRAPMYSDQARVSRDARKLSLRRCASGAGWWAGSFSASWRSC